MQDEKKRVTRPKQVFKGRRPPVQWEKNTADETLVYLRDLAKRLGKESVTCRDVKRDGHINPATVIRRFGGFSEALVRAGLRPLRIYKRNRTTMLSRLATLIGELGRLPSKTEVKKNLGYSAKHFEKEFGSLEKAGDLALASQSSAAKDGEARPALVRSSTTGSKKRRHYGAAIDVHGLRHAPINELGVVLLFGMLAEQLGFVIEGVQQGFPDCEAKLRRQDGTYEGVRIEFEFRSSEFLRHRHDPLACDILVCWLHDWSDCPVEVIALSDVIERLRNHNG